jgi:hypothetical protein
MKHFEESPVAVLRDCLELVSDRAPVPIEEVEPAADIMSRFCTGGMSLGAISREVRRAGALGCVDGLGAGGRESRSCGGKEQGGYQLQQDALGQSWVEVVSGEGSSNQGQECRHWDICTTGMSERERGRRSLFPARPGQL